MDIQLLGQGYEALSKNAVGNHLIRLLSDKEFNSVTIITAFISEAAVNGLLPYIEKAKEHFDEIKIITGIDQQGTSKEALEALINWNVHAYVFYQPSVTIFHPKIYLFEGSEKTTLIVGSSNLTAQGLFSNIEASLLLNIENSNEKDFATIIELKNYYKGLFDLSDPNLKKIDAELIETLVKAKVIPTKAEKRKSFVKEEEKGEIEGIRNIIRAIFPKRIIAKIPSFFRKKRTQKIQIAKKKEIITKPIQSDIKKSTFRNNNLLLWESGSLTKRDLNVQSGNNTNPTGSMLFKKGKNKNIDQRHFFRDEVFHFLDWQRDSKANRSHLERTKAKFTIIIEHENYGEFELKLTHNSNTASKTYQQKNSMTSISWGKAKPIVAKEKLIGKTLKLYRKGNTLNDFLLVIE